MPMYMIGGDAVGQRVRAAGIVATLPPIGAGGLAAWIGGVEEAVLGDRFGDIEVDDAGFDDGDAILQIDAQDAVEPRQRKHDPALGRHRAAGETRARAARDDRHAGLPGDLYDRGDVLTSPGTTTISGTTWKIEPSCS